MSEKPKFEKGQREKRQPVVVKKKHVGLTMEEAGYAICRTCNGEHLAFSLDDGQCYWCHDGLERGASLRKGQDS